MPRSRCQCHQAIPSTAASVTTSGAAVAAALPQCRAVALSPPAAGVRPTHGHLVGARAAHAPHATAVLTPHCGAPALARQSPGLGPIPQDGLLVPQSALYPVPVRRLRAPLRAPHGPHGHRPAV